LSSFFIDTNILVYAHDPRDPNRGRQARDILKRLTSNDNGLLSVQCLTEFYRAARWKIREPLSPQEALAQIERFTRSFLVLDLTSAIVLDACRGSGSYQLSIWDALIWATAKLNQVPFVLSEDFQDSMLLEGVRFLNPFADAFDVAALSTT
jgi:predicted nucleic acid-binding protein